MLLAFLLLFDFSSNLVLIFIPCLLPFLHLLSTFSVACFCSLFLICLQVCILHSEAGQLGHHARFLFFVHLYIIVVWHISFPIMFWFGIIVLLFRFHFPQFVSSWPITPQA
ncbi:hypothetical protein AAHE18_12G116600 [Arachis hypogaea]